MHPLHSIKMALCLYDKRGISIMQHHQMMTMTDHNRIFNKKSYHFQHFNHVHKNKLKDT